MLWKTWITKTGPKQKIYVVAQKKLSNKLNTSHQDLKNSILDNKPMKETCNFTNRHKKKYLLCMMKIIITRSFYLINVSLRAETKQQLLQVCKTPLMRTQKIFIRGLMTSSKRMPNQINPSKILKYVNQTPRCITLSSIRLQAQLTS